MSTLFPQGHKGDYTLQLKEDRAYMSMAQFQCPVCGVPFQALKVRDVKLIPLRTDPDLRVHYKDIEPMYYGITSCPNCRYSAQTALFTNLLMSRKKMIRDKLAPYLPGLGQWKGEGIDTQLVFEYHYLALLTAGVGFIDHELIEAGLWLKISRLYADSGDADMERFAAGEAQKTYVDAFQKIRIQPIKFPSLNLIIGALSVKIGDTRTARDFLYKVKVDKNSTRVQKDAADDFINDIKAAEEGN